MSAIEFELLAKLTLVAVLSMLIVAALLELAREAFMAVIRYFWPLP